MSLILECCSLTLRLGGDESDTDKDVDVDDPDAIPVLLAYW